MVARARSDVVCAMHAIRAGLPSHRGHHLAGSALANDQRGATRSQVRIKGLEGAPLRNLSHAGAR